MNIWLGEILRAWRASLRRPGFLLLASAVLALGVAASTGVITLVDQVLMKPLPVPQPSRLLVAGPHYKGHISAVSPQQYQHIGELQGVVSMGLVQDGPKVNVSGSGTPELVPTIYADHGLLPTVGLPMALGRNFSADEDRPNGAHVAILSHGFWQRRYGGDPGVIGRTLQVEGVASTIVGVLPAKFSALGLDGDIMLPTALPANSRNDGTNYMALLRLAAGSSAARVDAQVNAHLHAMYQTLGGQNSDYWSKAHFGVQPYADWQHHDARSVLVLFMASALFVLLIALVNLSSLMLLRTLSRNHDAAVRGALGAPHFRLILPALAEGVLVGLSGALLGLLLAWLGLEVLQSKVPADWLPDTQLQLGLPMLWVALALGLLSAVLASLFGFWRGHAASTVDELREGGRSGPGLRSGRLGRVLVVAQVALATTLLSAAGLFLHTLYDAANTPLGFASDNMLTFEMAPIKADYADAASVDALAQRMLERLRAVPGVSAVTTTTNLPSDLWNGQFNLGMHVPGGESFSAQYHGVGQDFFSLFRIPVQRGRVFDRNDVRGSEPVAVVSRSLAEHRFGGQALGQQLQLAQGLGGASARIVGVVGDTHQFGPLEPPPEVLYVPMAQMPEKAMSIFRSFEPLRFVLHGQGNPSDWRAALLQVTAAVAPGQPIANIRSMADIVRSTTADMRLNLLLVGLFAGLALLLAAAGLYAVMAVAVAAREREFGVRSALGASPSRLTTLVLRAGLVQIIIGMLLGIVLALTLSGALRTVMEQIGRQAVFDPVALSGVCMLLAMAGMLACLLPALRAGHVHPMRALRGE